MWYSFIYYYFEGGRGVGVEMGGGGYQSTNMI